MTKKHAMKLSDGLRSHYLTEVVYGGHGYFLQIRGLDGAHRGLVHGPTGGPFRVYRVDPEPRRHVGDILIADTTRDGIVRQVRRIHELLGGGA